MMKWKQLNGDCPKRDAPQLQERCDLPRSAESALGVFLHEEALALLGIEPETLDEKRTFVTCVTDAGATDIQRCGL
jgi:hypothetical protein